MNDIKQRIDKMVKELKKERDELQVKFHLAKMEVSDEWEEMNSKLEELEHKGREIRDAAWDASKGVGEAAELLGEEIRKGFKNIAKHF